MTVQSVLYGGAIGVAAWGLYTTNENKCRLQAFKCLRAAFVLCLEELLWLIVGLLLRQL